MKEEDRGISNSEAGEASVAPETTEEKEGKEVEKTEQAVTKRRKCTKEAKTSEGLQLELVRTLIQKLSKQLASADSTKGTVGDLLKLMQLEKDLAPREEQREVVVRWVAPWD